MAHQETNVSPVTASVKVGAKGRIVLPTAVREALKVEEGDEVLMLVAPDGSVNLSTRRIEARKLRGIFSHLKRPGESIVDEFIQERRAEERRERLRTEREKHVRLSRKGRNRVA